VAQLQQRLAEAAQRVGMVSNMLVTRLLIVIMVCYFDLLYKCNACLGVCVCDECVPARGTAKAS
jgi:hypothetical protein